MWRKCSVQTACKGSVRLGFFSACLIITLIANGCGAGGDAYRRLTARPEASCPPVQAHQDACPLVRVAPAYPIKGYANRGEAVALVAYRVLASGDTADVALVYLVGQPEFGVAAVAAVRQWKFEPARKKGVAVDSRPLRVAIPFRMTENAIAGARDEFTKELVIARNATIRHDLDVARAAIEKLDKMKWLTLYESAHRSLAAGILAYAEGRLSEAAWQLSSAAFFEGRYLGAKGYRDALSWSSRTAFEELAYGEALRFIETLEGLGNGPIPGDLSSMKSTLEEIRRGNQDLALTITVSAVSEADLDPIANYVPLRTRVVVDSTFPGSIGAVEISCQSHEEWLGEIESELIELREDWGPCKLAIHAAAGTDLRVVEPAQP